jgi:hypothetical protein
MRGNFLVCFFLSNPLGVMGDLGDFRSHGVRIGSRGPVVTTPGRAILDSADTSSSCWGPPFFLGERDGSRFACQFLGFWLEKAD